MNKIIWSMQYTLYSLLRKHGEVMSEKSWKNHFVGCIQNGNYHMNNMKYFFIIYNLFKKSFKHPFYKSSKNHFVAYTYFPKMSLLKWFRSNFYIIPYDQIWCKSLSKMMFKAIYMHTKPLKHTRNMQILTNYIKKNRFSKFLTKIYF